MNFRKEPVHEYYLSDTHVENVFINEYMTSAPGDFVKVYLFALMYAEYDIAMDNQTIAKQLSMEIEDVLKAWSYWESMGVIKKHFDNSHDKFNYKIELLNLKEKIYCGQKKTKKSQKGQEEKTLLEDADIRNMFNQIEKITGRIIGGKEPVEIISWIEDYNAPIEIILKAYEYAKSKKTTNYKYVATLLKDWVRKDFKSKEDVEKHLEETDNRHYLYKRILKSLGFMRNPTEAEKSIIDTWFDEMEFSLDKVLEACNKTSGINSPNINYVNSVLKAWEKGNEKRGITGSGGSNGKPNYIAQVLKSYEDSRANNESLSEERKQEVYSKIPKIKEIDEEARTLTFEMSKLMLGVGAGGKSKIESIKKKVISINTEKAFLLTENNFNLGHMDMMYSCPLCKDTGTQDTGDRCVCFAERLEHIQKKG